MLSSSVSFLENFKFLTNFERDEQLYKMSWKNFLCVHREKEVKCLRICILETLISLYT